MGLIPDYRGIIEFYEDHHEDGGAFRERVEKCHVVALVTLSAVMVTGVICVIVPSMVQIWAQD
jgi:hypothetical protein